MSGPDGRLLLAQTFVAVAGVTALVLAVVTSARQRAEQAERRIAQTLQHDLLPEAVPRIAGWEVATFYEPAGPEEEEVGGDFFEFFPTDTGWIVLLGDVVGKGVEAAALTGLMRHGARVISQVEERPAAILAHLDAALRQQPTMSPCSALCLRLQPDHVVLSCGGHPRPLVVRDDGRVREIDGGGPLLGLWPGCDWPERTVRLDQGETLFLFTDGVTDIRGETERFGDRRLRELLAAHARLAPAGLLAELGSALGRFGLGAQSDDTATLALRLELAHATKSRLSRNREALRA